MNRAWIPAGALAGVSVAGLIALGPLTDSLGNQVTFPTKIKTAQSSNPASKPALAEVPVSIELSTVGQVAIAAIVRGGQAKASKATNSTDGLVGVKVRPRTTTTPSTSRSTPTTHTAAAPAVKPKKVVKRQTTIGDIGESNPDHGLAGQSQQTSSGEQSSTPAP